MEPLITIDSMGAHITSDEVSKEFERKKISASMITGLEGCQARWLMDSFVSKKILPQEQDNPARRGSLFHSIMEDVFAHEPEERTTSLVKETVKKTLESPDYSDLKENYEVREWVRDAVNGYYKLGAKPQQIKVAKTVDKKGEVKPALEQFVMSRIGDSKRKTLGFIDRVIEDPQNEGKVIVEDWKTGAKAKQWDGVGDEGFPEQRQQTLYAMMLENQGTEVSRARLIYPIAQKIINVDSSDESLRQRVTEDVVKTDRTLDELGDTNTFEYKPTFLCHWCPLAKVCPESGALPSHRRKGKVAAAYDAQPSLKDLGDAVEFS